MPDISLPQQYDPITHRQVLETISFDDLDAPVQARLVPDGGNSGQFLQRTVGGLQWNDPGIPQFSIGNISTTTDISQASVSLNPLGTLANPMLDFVLPVGIGATPNIDVYSLINPLASGQQGQAYMSGPPQNRTLYLSLPLAPTPSFYVNSVQPGVNPFDAQVTVSGSGTPNVGFNFVLPRGLQGITGTTPVFTVNPVVNALPVGSQGTVAISGAPETPQLAFSLPLSPVPQFTIGSVSLVAYGFSPFVTLGGSPAFPQLNFGIPQGAPGQSPNLQIGTVQAGSNPSDAQASITGTPLNPFLNLTLPRGLTGLTPNITFAGTVIPLPVGSQGTATTTGTPENPVVSLSLPLSPVPVFTIGTVTTFPFGAPATASITGTPANPLLNLGLPQGQIGATPNLTVNPVVTPLPVGSQGQATITGTPANPYLNLSLPLSPVPIFTAQANTLPYGSPATASISGTPANPLLTVGIPQGQIGQSPVFTMGIVNTLPPNTPASATITGTPLAPVLNLNLPQGAQGNGGVTINGTLYNNILAGGLGTDGGILADPTGQPVGTVRLIGSHRLLNAAGSVNSRTLVQNPGDATSHTIKQIKGIDPISVTDAGTELQIGLQTLPSSLMPAGNFGQTLWNRAAELGVNQNRNSWLATSVVQILDLPDDQRFKAQALKTNGEVANIDLYYSEGFYAGPNISIGTKTAGQYTQLKFDGDDGLSVIAWEPPNYFNGS